MDIKDVLQNLGYSLKDDGDFWRAKPLYRESSNSTSLRISKKNGWFIDFSANLKGPFQELVKITTGAKDIEEVERYLDSKSFFMPKQDEEPKISMKETWDLSIVDTFIKENSYWNNRGITDETLEEFKGGLAQPGRMGGRYVFPIINRKNRVVGLSGRDITNKSPVKWKHLGEKKDWLFPSHIKREEIEASGEIILVEGIGDVLQLWQCGYRNVLCLFGVSISDKLVSSISTLKVDKIIISTNNDVENNNVGNLRSIEIYEKLVKFCNKEKVQIKLPTKKDFLEMSPEEISAWHKKKVLAVVGSRDFSDMKLFNSFLKSQIDTTATIVSGGAKGADSMARDFAIQNKIPLIEFLPDWKKYKKAAGMIRNEDIINNADKVIAFHKNHSRGTANSILLATMMDKPIEIVNC